MSERLADRLHIHFHEPSSVFTMTPVPGEPISGVYTITASNRSASCLRYVGGPPTCDDKYIRLYAADDGSGLQRWRVIRAASPGRSETPPMAQFNGAFDVNATADGPTSAAVILTYSAFGTQPISAQITYYAVPQGIGAKNMTIGVSITSSSQFVALQNLSTGTTYAVVAVGKYASGTMTPPSNVVYFSTVFAPEPPPPPMPRVSNLTIDSVAAGNEAGSAVVNLAALDSNGMAVPGLLYTVVALPTTGDLPIIKLGANDVIIMDGLKGTNRTNKRFYSHVCYECMCCHHIRRILTCLLPSTAQGGRPTT